MSKDLIDKEFELLKLSYDSSRTWALSFLALMITSFIGYSSLISSNPSAGIALFRCMLFFLVGTVFLYIIESRNYMKLRKYLKKE